MKTKCNYTTWKNICTGVMVIIFALLQLNGFSSESEKATARKNLNTIDREVIYKLENWMTNSESWFPGEEEKVIKADSGNSEADLTAKTDVKMDLSYDSEEEVIIEDWMIDSNHEFWTNPDFKFDDEQEPAIEDWMIDLSLWK